LLLLAANDFIRAFIDTSPATQPDVPSFGSPFPVRPLDTR
jgi:hypothetical protein